MKGGVHDRGFSGWWSFLHAIPILGSIALIWILLTPGKRGPNRYGPAPEEPTV